MPTDDAVCTASRLPLLPSVLSSLLLIVLVCCGSAKEESNHQRSPRLPAEFLNGGSINRAFPPILLWVRLLMFVVFVQSLLPHLAHACHTAPCLAFSWPC